MRRCTLRYRELVVLSTAIILSIAATDARAYHPTWAPDAYALRYFSAGGQLEGLKHAAFAARYELSDEGERLAVPRLRIGAQVSVGTLWKGGSDGVTVALGPIVQWDVLPRAGGLYLDIGAAPTYLGRTRYDGADLGGHLAFTLHAVIGWQPASGSGPFVGIGAQHISNANIYEHNPGANFIGAVVGWRLR
ncbi:MAG: acyloxyacyl hydrolase [Nitrococcus sp.]|nr:acyloxyacyl hydrolase [Nitrococcus sp.]